MGKKSESQWKKEAAEAAVRMARAHAQGEQLNLLPDLGAELPPVPVDGDEPQRGRPKGAKNKNDGQVRQWLATRGVKMPEQVLAELIGQASDQSAMLHAMTQAEALLTWAYDGAEIGKGGLKAPSASQRLEAFKYFYTAILRAADALLPYVAPKSTPDGDERPPVFVMVPGAPVVGSLPPNGPPGEIIDAQLTPWQAAALRDGRIKENQVLSEAQSDEKSEDRRRVEENDDKSES